MPATSYQLLAAVGQSPQIITETIWSLARQHRPVMTPETVHVVTTAAGAAYIRALLLGESSCDPVRGVPIDGAMDRWTPFCEEVLGRDPIPIRTHVPGVEGFDLNDVRTVADDRHFADLCYELVAELTESPRPLIGSIAGGRKTMSAHLMTAFSVYARPEDRLTHVLVTPTRFERDRTFFYPTSETAAEAQVHRVDLQFPRLHHIVQEGLIDALPADRRNLQAILDALEPHLVREKTPDEIRIHLGGNAAYVILRQENEELGRCRLTPTVAATLLVVLDRLVGQRKTLKVQDLYSTTMKRAGLHPVHKERTAVVTHLNRLEEPAAWMLNDDVTKAMHSLRKALADAPIAARYFSFETELRANETLLRLPEPMPAPITVTAEVLPLSWPFDHLPEPVREPLPAE